MWKFNIAKRRPRGNLTMKFCCGLDLAVMSRLVNILLFGNDFKLVLFSN